MKLDALEFNSIIDRTVVRQLAVGWLFWLGFLLLLQPGNIVRAEAADMPAPLAEEVIRIILASILAGATAPLQFRLVRVFPVAGVLRLRNLFIHFMALAGLSLFLIVVAAMLAPFILAPDNPRLQTPITDQIAANAPLLAFAMAALAVILHLPPRKTQERSAPCADQRWLTSLPVQTRAGVTIVAAGDIDWIEAQGNYVALHVGADAYLIRQTLSRLAETLNPEHFLRIHRRKILNKARLRKMIALPGGDALVELTDGTELRASRTFCSDLRASFRSV